MRWSKVWGCLIVVVVATMGSAALASADDAESAEAAARAEVTSSEGESTAEEATTDELVDVSPTSSNEGQPGQPEPDASAAEVGAEDQADVAAVPDIDQANWFWSEHEVGGTLTRGTNSYWSVRLHTAPTPEEIVLHFKLPEGVSLARVTEHGADQLTCTPGIEPGEYSCPAITQPNSTSFDLVFFVGPDVPLGIAADVLITAEQVNESEISDPNNNSYNYTFDVVGWADLSYQVTPEGQTLALGQTLEMTATVTNHGPDPATKVVVTLVTTNYAQGELRFVSVGSPDAEIVDVTDGSLPNSKVRWSVPQIPVGESVSLTFTVVAQTLPTVSANGAVFISATATERDGVCETDFCEYSTRVRIVDTVPTNTSTSVAPSPTSTPTSATSGTTSGTSTTVSVSHSTSSAPTAVKSPHLAATGQAVGGLAVYGGISVLVGVAFLLSARRRKA